MNNEIRERLASLVEEMHADVNSSLNTAKNKAAVGSLKRSIRGYRDTLRQLIEEFSL